jgi:hypothetical protein
MAIPDPGPISKVKNAYTCASGDNLDNLPAVIRHPLAYMPSETAAQREIHVLRAKLKDYEAENEDLRKKVR